VAGGAGERDMMDFTCNMVCLKSHEVYMESCWCWGCYLASSVGWGMQLRTKEFWRLRRPLSTCVIMALRQRDDR
jgi:hypothetical protein